jgi:hypothetical protein
LQTARNIGGVSFNGTANIDLPGVNTSGNQNTSGNAATATTTTNWGTYGGVPAPGASFGTANTIGRSDANGYAYFNYINSNTSNSENPGVSQVIVTNGGDNFYRKASIAHLTSSLSGTAPINISGNATNVTGTVAVANGGTGVTSSTGTGAVVLSNSPTLVTPALGTPASGDLSNTTADGTTAVGFRTIPQNSQSAAYTLVLADSGKHIFHPVADNNARTFTIPANSSVAYPIGTAITFINMSVANVTIAITTDTLTLSPAGTAGSRTLATNGSATCVKITATQWLISGSGLT